MKRVVFLLCMSVFLLTGCMDDDSSPETRYLSVPVYTANHEFYGEQSRAIKKWTQDDESLYHVRFRDYNELFLFDCVATTEKPRLMGGFMFSNLEEGYNSVFPLGRKGVRGYSYVTYRHNPGLESANPIGISFREVGDPSKSKAYKINGMYVANACIGYEAMSKGNENVKQFGSGDYLTLTIWNGDKSKKVDFALANGTKIVSDWTYVKLGALGVTDGLYFELTSSQGDVTELHSLSYFCLDGMIIEDAE